MIKVSSDRSKRLVVVRCGGMLELAEVKRLFDEEQAAAREMGCRGGDFDLLVVSEDALVQSQVVTQALSDLMLSSNLKARRIATVREGALSQLQARRVSGRRAGTSVFGSVADAMAWLAEGEIQGRRPNAITSVARQ